MGFDEFRRSLENWGQQRLEDERPKYVNAFRAELVASKDLESATRQARSSLGEPLSWIVLLTRAMDVEIGRRQLFLAVQVVGHPAPSDDVTPGAWAVYQANMWWVSAAGLLERVEKLAVATCRRLISDKGDRTRVSDHLIDDIGAWRDRIKNVRDAVAHGGGPVEAMEADRLWEVHLVLGVDGFEEVVKSYFEFCMGKQSRWHSILSAATSQLSKDMDVWFDYLTSEAMPMPKATA